MCVKVCMLLGGGAYLLLDGDNDVACLVVKSLGGVVVADVLDGIADDLLVVDRRAGGNLAEDHDHASLAAGFAGNTGGLVVLDAGVKDGIRDLVAELVGVALVDRLRGEEEGRHICLVVCVLGLWERLGLVSQCD